MNEPLLGKQRKNFINTLAKACKDGDAQYQCPKCPYKIKLDEFNSKTDFEAHLRQCIVPLWVCAQCQKTTNKRSHYILMTDSKCDSGLFPHSYHSMNRLGYNYEALYKKIIDGVHTRKRGSIDANSTQVRKKAKKENYRILPHRIGNYSAAPELSYLSFEEWYACLFGSPDG